MPDHTETLAPKAPDDDGPDGPDREPCPEESEVEYLAADDPERYESVNEHARGGLGRVVRAVDRRLNRTVAVKELLRHDASNEARFLREAMITARLEHPGIVPVHEAGRWPNGDPYYVMKLVEGRTLKQLICERATMRERLGLLPNVIAVADAVGYAHKEEVIHRDLKPANIIVGDFGETIVVDWGLACDRKRGPEPVDDTLAAALGSGASTVSGKVIGTPAYMSPEQARGDTVDERGDVYALGAVLYEMLAGTPPHADTTPQAVLDRVIAGPPRPLPMMVPGVPSELATIVHKAMARDPDARYSNASALAEDLRRFTTGNLVSAHSYSTWALIRKRLARYRGVVAVVIASLLALAIVGVVSVRHVVAERNVARDERTRAEDALQSAEKRKRELVLLQAETALPKDPTAALAWLKTYDVGPTDRGTVVDVIDEALALGVARHVFWANDWVFDAQFTPDGASVVALVRDGSLRRYDLRTGFETRVGQARAPECMALSDDGKLVITGSSAGEVVVWPIDGGAPRVLVEPTGRSVSHVRVHDGKVLAERETAAPMVVALAGDHDEPEVLASTTGLRFAVAADDWSHIVMTAAPNELVVALRGGGTRLLAHTDRAILRLAISPRGDQVLVFDGQMVWSIPFTGGVLRPLAPAVERLSAAAWSPDGKWLAFASARPEISLVELATGAVSELRGHTDALYTLHFSGDSQRLLSASDDATVRVWRLSTRTSSALLGHEDDVYGARFSPDERSVISASLDGSMRLWQLDAPGATIFDQGVPIEDLRIDGDRATVMTETEAVRWDLSTGAREPLFSWATAVGSLGSGVVSSDGARLAIPNADGTIELRARDGATRVLRGHRGLITKVEFARDGQALFTTSSDGTLRRWDVATGRGELLIDGTVPIRGFAIARVGRVSVQAGDASYLVEGGAVHLLGKGGAWCVLRTEFEPVLDRLVLHRCDRSLAMVDRTAGGDRIVEMATGGYAAGDVAVSPDGRRVAAGMGDRTIRMWDAYSGQVIDILRGHADAVYGVAFSPDGNQLVSASYDKTARIWDLSSNRHRVLRGHSAAVTKVAWHRAAGGEPRVVTASTDGTLRIWRVPSLGLPSSAEIIDRLNNATSARIDRDRPASTPRTSHGT